MMTALTTMEAALNEIEEESPPFAIDESETEQQSSHENLFSSPTSMQSVASSQRFIGQMKGTSPIQSPISRPQHQQHDSSPISFQSNSRILEESSFGIPTKTLLTDTPTSANFAKLAPDSSLLISQHDTESTTTNSTSSMNSSGSNASLSSSSHLLLPFTEESSSSSDGAAALQQHRMQASSTIMASSLFTVPLNSDSTMSLQTSRHNVKGAASSSKGRSCSSMRFSQLMQTADDTNLPAVPEDEPMESFEMFGSREDILQPTAHHHHNHQVPNYSPHSQHPPRYNEGNNNQWFFNLLSAAKRASQPSRNNASNQITILDASTSRLNTPLLATPAATPFFGGMDRARARVTTSLENDSNSFEVAMNFKASSNIDEQQQECTTTTVEDIMNIVSNPTNLQLWYDPIQTVVVTSRSNEENGGGLNGNGSGDGSHGSADRQYEGEWIEASTTALTSPTSLTSPLYELESTVRASLGVGSYGLITIFVEKTNGKVTMTVGPFPGGIHLRHTISVFQDGRGGVKIVDRVKLETKPEDVSTFQNTLSLGGMLNSCMLPPLTSYMGQVKNSMAKLLLLVESGQVSRSGGGGLA